MKATSRRDSFLETISQIRAEREAARPIVDRLRQDIPEEVWNSEWPLKWCTAGLVEELAMGAESVRLTNARHALAMAQLALSVVGGISLTEYPRPLRSRLEGIAWFEIGSAHYAGNSYEAALVAYKSAQGFFSRESALIHEESITKIARAGIHLLRGEKQEAGAVLADIEGIFLTFDDTRRDLMHRLLTAITGVLCGDVALGQSEFDQIRTVAVELAAATKDSFFGRIGRVCSEIIAGDGSSPVEHLPGLITDVVSWDGDQERGDHRPSRSFEIRLDQVLALPQKEAEAFIRREPEFHTAEATRFLIDSADYQTDFDPPFALKLSTLAVAAADCLSELTHSTETIAFLKGSACRQIGIALYYAARYPEALEFYERADHAFDGSAAATYEKGRVATYRAIVNIVLDRHAEAMASAHQSQQAFQTFPDARRLASARFAEGNVYFKLCEWKKTLEIFEEIRREFMNVLEIEMQARVQANIASCHLHLGENDAAAIEYYLAIRLFEQAGTMSEAARMRWSLATLAQAEGKIEEALQRYDQAARDLFALGMVAEAAGVHLDTAELLLAIGEHERAVELCRSALEQYRSSGMAVTKRALIALAYLTEAAHSATATPELVQHVKEYLRRLPHEPALLFAPPPQPPAKPE